MIYLIDERDFKPPFPVFSKNSDVTKLSESIYSSQVEKIETQIDEAYFQQFFQLFDNEIDIISIASILDFAIITLASVENLSEGLNVYFSGIDIVPDGFYQISNIDSINKTIYIDFDISDLPEATLKNAKIDRFISGTVDLAMYDLIKKYMIYDVFVRYVPSSKFKDTYAGMMVKTPDRSEHSDKAVFAYLKSLNNSADFWKKKLVTFLVDNDLAIDSTKQIEFDGEPNFVPPSNIIDYTIGGSI